MLALSYQKHVRGLHRFLLQCDLFTPNHLAPTPTPTTCASSPTPTAPAPTSTPSSPIRTDTRSTSQVDPDLDLTSSPAADINSSFLSEDDQSPREYNPGIANPVFCEDQALKTSYTEDITARNSTRALAASQASEDQRGEPLYVNSGARLCAAHERPRSESLDSHTAQNGSFELYQRQKQQKYQQHQNQIDCIQSSLPPSSYTWEQQPNHQSFQRVSDCHIPQQNCGQNQNAASSAPFLFRSNCEETTDRADICPAAAATPFTTSGSSHTGVDNRKKTARVSWSIDPADPADLTRCQNNNTKPHPCVDLAATSPTTTLPHSLPAYSRPSATLQPSAQPPFTANFNGPSQTHHNHRPRHNHSGKHNHHNNRDHQPFSQENHNSPQIPPPGRDHHYPYHNHHRQQSYPYHILPPQEPQPAETKTTPPPPPPPPQSPDGSGGRSSPPPPPLHGQIPASSGGKTTSGPEPLAGGPRRKPPAPLRPGVAAGPALSRGGTTSGCVPSVTATMSCPSGQACSMGGGSSNGGGGNGNGGSAGTEIQRRNLGFGGSGTSAASAGPGKRSLQHQNPEKHMEACARMPDEDITVLDENPVLIVPVQEPEPRPSTKISLPTVKSKVGVAGATKR